MEVQDSAVTIIAAEREAERELLLATLCEEGEVEAREGEHVWRVVPSSGKGAVTLVADLPLDYPTAPAVFSIEAPTLLAAARQRLIAALEDELKAGSVFAAATRLASLLDGELSECATSRAADNGAFAVNTEWNAETIETALVRIDHMNDLKGYLQAIELISTARPHAGARVFWRKSERHAAVDVLLVLRAPADTPRGSSAIDSALTRLRTECVDVDRRGSKCKERQSQVLRRRCERRADAPCFERERFADTPYVGHAELLAQLSSLGGALCKEGVGEEEIRRDASASRGAVPSTSVLPCVRLANCGKDEDNAAALLISCEVKPNKQLTAIAPHPNDAPNDAEALGVDLAAPPREGQANAELLAAIASWLGVALRDVSIAAGGKARRKVVRVEASTGLSPAEVSSRLVSAADGTARSVTRQV